mgnify:CR=1 FL=1
MTPKFHTLKSIKQALIGPNILFSSAYLLFSAEVCTRTAKNRSSSYRANTSLLSLSTNPGSNLDAIKGLSPSPSNQDGSVESFPVNVSIISLTSEADSAAEEAVKRAEAAKRAEVLAVAKALEADSAASEAVKKAEAAKRAEALAVAKALEVKLATTAAETVVKKLSESESVKLEELSVIKASEASEAAASSASEAAKLAAEAVAKGLEASEAAKASAESAEKSVSEAKLAASAAEKVSESVAENAESAVKLAALEAEKVSAESAEKSVSVAKLAAAAAEKASKAAAAAKRSAAVAEKELKVSLEEKSTVGMMPQATESVVKSVGVNTSKASKASKAVEVNSAASEPLSVAKASAVPGEVSNLVVQSEVEKNLVPSEANTGGLKADRPNLAHQARTDSHKPESSSGCNRVSQYSEPLFENREAAVGRSVAPFRKPKKEVRFIEDPEVRIFEVEEESAPAQRLVETPLEVVGLSFAKSSLCKSLKKNTQKAWKKIFQKTKHKSPNSQNSANADIPVDEQSKNDKNSNQMSQSIGLLSQNKEAGSADRSIESSAVSNSIVDLSPSTDNSLVDQPMENDATKEAQENKKLNQELDEVLGYLMSLTDDMSDVYEEKITHEMEDMVSNCKTYLA